MAAEGDSGEKTEDGTPRRREEAREKGQVPFSTEFVAALALLAAFGLYLKVGGPVLEVLGQGIRRAFAQLSVIGTDIVDIPVARKVMNEAGRSAIKATAMFAGPLLALSVLAAYGQIGLYLSPKAAEVDPSKLNPLKGLKRMFSMRTVVRTGLAILKIIAIGTAIFMTITSQLGRLNNIGGIDLGPALVVTDNIITRAIIAGIIAILVLGVIDFAYQRWQHKKELMMSKQEVREENKNSEGDPHIKARIRQVQREMASRRMMDEVPDATVVVTNPTHYAVALRYERTSEDGGAPRVVAKGVDHVAQKIKQLARDNDIVCFENVPLARALHAQCEIGDVIPEELFEAVASVLAYVYGVQTPALAA